MLVQPGDGKEQRIIDKLTGQGFGFIHWRNDTMKKCILCGTMTKGSVGAAGIKWSMICQPCKDKEDASLAGQIEHMSKCMDWVFDRVRNPKQRD